MGFMHREEYNGAYWEIDTTHGTWFLPYAYIGEPSEWAEYVGPDATGMYGAPDDDSHADAWASIRAFFADYTEGGADSIDGVQYHPNGTLYRMSAPGHMDCTEWTTDPDSPEFDDAE